MIISQNSILLSLWLSILLCMVSGQIATTNVKIVDGIDKLSSSEDNNLDAVIPEALSGPESLYFLNGLCFMKSIERFEYNVCPFQNVTQRRITGNYPTILGVWGNWVEPRGGTNQIKTYKTMNYIDGKSCGDGTVDTKLELECGHDGPFDVLGVDDSAFCSYSIRLGVPLACSLFIK